MFKAGQKVVCVNDQDFDDTPPEGVELFGALDGLEEGKIYTIREVFIDPVWGDSEIRLQEIIRPHDSFDPFLGFYECGFHPSRFRPIVKRKTDITIFKDILRYAYAQG